MLSLLDAMDVLDYVDFTALLHHGEGFVFPVYGKPRETTEREVLRAEVIQVEVNSEPDYETEVKLTVRIGDQFFQKKGSGYDESHGIYDSRVDWCELREVRPSNKTVIVFDSV